MLVVKKWIWIIYLIVYSINVYGIFCLFFYSIFKILNLIMENISYDNVWNG